MKLKEYIKKLQKVAETHPNVTVIYSKDDEGNQFSELNYPPAPETFGMTVFSLMMERKSLRTSMRLTRSVWIDFNGVKH